MASNQNPFAHWTAGNANSNNGNWNPNLGPPPSIVGALPYLNPTYPLPPDDQVKFIFTSFNPTILNCTVLGPNNRPYFLVVTDASMVGYTIWKDAENRNIALVEWQNSPLVEARGILPKQQAGGWLRLAPDRSHRTMDVRGRRYFWTPRDDFICLYSTEYSTPRIIARIGKSYNIVSLEMTSAALDQGLLEVCVVTTVLLQCGRNID